MAGARDVVEFMQCNAMECKKSVMATVVVAIFNMEVAASRWSEEESEMAMSFSAHKTRQSVGGRDAQSERASER